MPRWVGCNTCDWIEQETPVELEQGLGPCPRCGGTDRGFSIDEAGQIRGFSTLADHCQQSGKKKEPILEVQAGDERFHNTKSWRKLPVALTAAPTGMTR